MTTAALTFNVDLSKATGVDQDALEIQEVFFALTTELEEKTEKKTFQGTLAVFPMVLAYLESIGTTKVVCWHLDFLLKYIQKQCELLSIDAAELFGLSNNEAIVLTRSAFSQIGMDGFPVGILPMAQKHCLQIKNIHFKDMMLERYGIQQVVGLQQDENYSFAVIAKQQPHVCLSSTGLKGAELRAFRKQEHAKQRADEAYKMEHNPLLVTHEAFEQNRRLLVMNNAHRSIKCCLNYDFS